AEIRAHLLPLEVLRVQAHQDLQLVPEPVQHRDLVVRSEARQHARGMVVVEELAAHLQVQLPADLVAAVLDVARLQLDVLLAVEADRASSRGRRSGGGGRGGGTGIRVGHPGTLAPSQLTATVNRPHPRGDPCGRWPAGRGWTKSASIRIDARSSAKGSTA